jgi:hypothetical protein
MVKRLLLLMLLAGCGDTPPTEPALVSLILSRRDVKMLTGGTLDVDAVPIGLDGQVEPAAGISWSSSNPAVATVSSLGVVTTLAPGTAFIRATASQQADSMRLEVATATFDTVAAGGLHTCAMTAEGEAYCWGENFNGALGTGDTLSNPSPLAVRTSLRFSWLAVSQRTTCGMATTGEAYCWGSNGSGQLGLGSSDAEDHTEPAAVTGGRRFTWLSAGPGSTCGVAEGGTGFCWGSNVSGLLGNGVLSDAVEPSPISGGLTLATVSVGQVHACGITITGDAYCWGEADGGRLGNGSDLGGCGGVSPSSCSRTPVAVTGGLGFEEVSVGQAHTCGIITTGAGYCWGLGSYLGDGTTGTANQPVPVTGGLMLHGITTGGDATDANNHHTCAIDSAGQAYCWGANGQGQLGTGSISDVATSPVLVTGGLTWQSLTAGANHTCGLATNARVYCWGAASGNLNPTEVPGQS